MKTKTVAGKKKIKLKTRVKVMPFTEVQERRYLQRKEISEEMKLLEKRVAELKDDRKKLDEKLGPVFEQSNDRRELSDGTIVERKVVDIAERICTLEMVGNVLQSGYSFPKYTEVAGG